MSSLLEIAKEVIQTEIEGLLFMSTNLCSDFDKAVDVIINSSGRTIICGMGKSGLIGKKISASFASTGTASYFMHPGEAFHGDLGMVKPEDIIILISNSGETEELLKLLPFLSDNGNFIISLTGNKTSSLAVNSHCHLNIAVPKEACALQLAPTASTTATLVMGDALTVALMNRRCFNPENFARFHPGGNLGRILLSKVRDEMVSDNLPFVSSESDFTSVINKISSSYLGLTLVNFSNESFGIITDGDIRRAMDRKGQDSFNLLAKDIASLSPTSISPDCSVKTAYELMTSKGITSLVVYDGTSIVGILKK